MYVARLPSGDAADHGQEHATVHCNAVAAARSGVAPAAVHFDPGTGIILTRFVDGVTLTPAAVEADRSTLLPLFVGAVQPRLRSLIGARRRTWC